MEITRARPYRPPAVRKETITVMGETDLDISCQRSKSVDEFVGKPLDS